MQTPDPNRDQGLNRAFADSYEELRRIAHSRMSSFRGSATLLDTTMIVHESYLRLLNAGRLRTSDRAQFIAYSSRVIRSVVVDYARQRAAERRGGGIVRIAITREIAGEIPAACREVLKLHEALNALESISERLVRVVEMRYFCGMSELEIGEALGLTERTVRRDWEKARLLLAAELA